MKTIAIGVGENENIIQACHIFKEKHPKTNLKLIYRDEDLVRAVLDDKINGVVRGSLPAGRHPILRGFPLRRRFGDLES